VNGREVEIHSRYALRESHFTTVKRDRRPRRSLLHGSTNWPILEPTGSARCDGQPDGRHAGNAEVSFPVVDLSTAEPVCILLYPDRTHVVFAGRERAVSKRTRTITGTLPRARRAAQQLRELGARVSVFREEKGSRKRVLVEVRLPRATGDLRPKFTRFFRSETEAVSFLREATNDASLVVGSEANTIKETDNDG